MSVPLSLQWVCRGRRLLRPRKLCRRHRQLCCRGGERVRLGTLRRFGRSILGGGCGPSGNCKPRRGPRVDPDSWICRGRGRREAAERRADQRHGSRHCVTRLADSERGGRQSAARLVGHGHRRWRRESTTRLAGCCRRRRCRSARCPSRWRWTHESLLVDCWCRALR